ncbi:MAG TPA: hypothetical protein VGP43_02490 [Chitinophagaceae bacterium]|nr:hypothetical protein [Chitinophagaceae bacterium]
MAEYKILDLIPENLRPKLIEEVQEILNTVAKKKESEKAKEKISDEMVKEIVETIMP